MASLSSGAPLLLGKETVATFAPNRLWAPWLDSVGIGCFAPTLGFGVVWVSGWYAQHDDGPWVCSWNYHHRVARAWVHILFRPPLAHGL